MSKIIILIGKTGSGKSTLANVITGTNKFKESGSSASVTKEIQKEEFLDNDIKYAVIDTVGIGDTQLKKEEVLDKIAEAVYLAKEGVSQVLFVTNGRFDQFEMSTYHLLRTIIFDEHITKYTTIVRTKFSEFYDEEICQADIKKMLSERELCSIVNSCHERIIHVSNPPVARKSGEELKMNEEERTESREKLLEHLQSCQKKADYKPRQLQALNAEIAIFMEEKIKKREELKKKQRIRTKEAKKKEETQRTNEKNSTVEDNKNEPVAITTVKKEQINSDNKPELTEETREEMLKPSIKLSISFLENELKELAETKQLIEEIQKTEGIIRQRVLNHIFNNLEAIRQVTGGDIFINSIVGNDNQLLTSQLSLTELEAQRKALEAKLLEKKHNDQSLEQVEKELSQKEKDLLDLKMQLLSIGEIFAKWQNQGFSIQEAQAWANVLGSEFSPEDDAPFCDWLLKSKQIVASDQLSVEEIKRLKYEYNPQQHDKISDTKKILLIGRSGRGKSTLANVLTNTNTFKENPGSVSETRKVQFEQFEDTENNIQYSIIDTPGIGDTKLNDNEVLDIIAEAVYLVKDGISQVFFVTHGRFDQYEMTTYNLLRTIIFDHDITKNTTIIRTRFSDFRNKEECEKDIALMMSENNDNSTNLQEILTSCQKKVIHVDNPSLNAKRGTIRNKNKRADSRDKLLQHLSNLCHSAPYQPPKLQQLSEAIAEDYFQYLKKKEELAKELAKIKVNSGARSAVTLLQPSLTVDAKVSVDHEVLLVEETSQPNQTAVLITDNKTIIDQIAQLESKKQRLQWEIKEKEELIRQKVLKHIFNNYENINNELGGNIFLNSVIGDHDWQVINPQFADKGMVIKWLSKEFDYEQVKKWATALGKSFNPKLDLGFCAWLRDEMRLSVEKIELLTHVSNIEQLRKKYVQQLEKETVVLERHNSQQLISDAKNSAQQWLDENYPKSQRNHIKKFNIRYQNLTGSLGLSDFVNLEYLDCSNNQLINLDLTGCANLREIWCSSNQLTSLDFLTTLPHPEKLTYLSLSHNPLAFTLDSLVALVNLEKLDLRDTKVYGSLTPLGQCWQLKWLDISDTNLASDLESLLAHLETLWAEGMPAIKEKMAGFKKKDGWGDNCYDYQSWRKAHSSNLPESRTTLMQQIKEVEADNDIKEDIKKAQLTALHTQLAAVEAQLLVAQQVQVPK